MYIYSLYSGIIYQLPDHFYSSLDDGQMPLTQIPKLCNKCAQRGYAGFNTTTHMYNMCKCVEKHLNYDKIKSKFKPS